MTMLRKIFFTIFLATIAIIPWQVSFAQENDEKVNVYFFWGDGCPHCAKEKLFLEKLDSKYPEVVVQDFEIYKSRDNQKLLVDFGEKLDANVSGVPFTVVGDRYFSGWRSESTTGASIEKAVKQALDTGCRDVGEEVIGNTGEGDEESCDAEEESSVPEKISVPFLGDIETKNLSLPVLTIVMGILDGFNPCAMWALIFLISLLLGMKDKKRMWIFGTAFIVTSAIVYFFFMAAWLNLILFLGMVVWVRLLIGLFALFGGGYNLREYFTNPVGACKVTKGKEKQKIFEKLKEFTHLKSFYLALGGIIVLAFVVNLVELICSAGLPAVYTQVLALSNLETWQYYAYLVGYIFFFMLDDLIVFFIAMITLQMTGVTTKYSRWSHLIGGILMLIIGLLLIFKPELLMFG